MKRVLRGEKNVQIKAPGPLKTRILKSGRAMATLGRQYNSSS